MISIFVLGAVFGLISGQNARNSDRITYPGETANSRLNPLGHNHRYHYHHHHHDHDYDDMDNVREVYKNDTEVNEIPVDFVAKLNGVSYTVNDLLLRFVDGYEEDDSDPLESRFGEERGNVQIPKPAACMPELQTVSLRQSEDKTIMYIPSCTRIERCGGCCNHNKLECRPTKDGIESINFQVIKAEFRGTSKLRYVEKIPVAVERHNKCECGCRTRPEVNCTLRQEYRENECRCVCRNTDEQKKCLKEPTKLWDPDACECQCRNSTLCSTGTTFDYQLCRCVVSPSVRRRYVEFPNEKGNVDFEVIPLPDD